MEVLCWRREGFKTDLATQGLLIVLVCLFGWLLELVVPQHAGQFTLSMVTVTNEMAYIVILRTAHSQ